MLLDVLNRLSGQWQVNLETRVARTELYEKRIASSRPSLGFFVLLISSAVIATLGLISNSTAVVIGAMIIAGIEDEANSTLVGVFLNYGGGVYLYISLVEIAPLMFASGEDTKYILKQLFGFCVGVMALGLVLLNHEHCSIAAEGETGGHAH